MPDTVVSDAAVPPGPYASARKSLRALTQRLAADPQSLGFFSVMRQFEAVYADRPRLGRSLRPAQDAIRLGQEPSVVHAPGALASFTPGQDGAPDRLAVHFFGLFGPDGPLPLHLTEYARLRRRHHGDPVFQRFCDLFHHRAISLFYRAWADVRPTVSFDRPREDRFGHYLGALCGLSTPGLRDRDAMPDQAKLHFAGHLGAQTRHAEGLASILTAFFTVPVRIAGFQGLWLRLDAAEHTRLGQPQTARLGRGALLGGRVWSRQDKFRVVLGPLSLPQYERLLPGGDSFRTLVPLVRNYAGDALAWDANLVLRREEVPATRLGQYGRLGWTTWLKPRRATHDADDLRLDAGADSLARRLDDASPPSTDKDRPT